MAQLIRLRVISYEQCIRESWVDDRRAQPAQQNPSEHIKEPEDAMQIDWVPELPHSGGYEPHSDSHGCVFQISVCQANMQSRCENNRKNLIHHD